MSGEKKLTRQDKMARAKDLLRQISDLDLSDDELQRVNAAGYTAKRRQQDNDSLQGSKKGIYVVS
jgi:hypothetical protein